MGKRSNLIEEIKNYQANEDDNQVSADTKNFMISLFAELIEVPSYNLFHDDSGDIRLEFSKINHKQLRICGKYIYWERNDKYKDNYGIVRNLTPQKIKNAILWLSK
jgi:hypothetical protein